MCIIPPLVPVRPCLFVYLCSDEHGAGPGAGAQLQRRLPPVRRERRIRRARRRVPRSAGLTPTHLVVRKNLL